MEHERILDLLKWLESGVLDSIPCPNCGQPTVSVWFTRPAPEEYRTWFTCGNCPFRTRANNTMKPDRFSEERRSLQLEQQDKEVLRQLKFRPPRPGQS